MPQLNHAAYSPLRALALVTQTATRGCAEAMQNVWRWCGDLPTRAHGGDLQRCAWLPVGVVPAAAPAWGVTKRGRRSLTVLVGSLRRRN